MGVGGIVMMMKEHGSVEMNIQLDYCDDDHISNNNECINEEQ